MNKTCKEAGLVLESGQRQQSANVRKIIEQSWDRTRRTILCLGVNVQQHAEFWSHRHFFFSFTAHRLQSRCKRVGSRGLQGCLRTLLAWFAWTGVNMSSFDLIKKPKTRRWRVFAHQLWLTPPYRNSPSFSSLRRARPWPQCASSLAPPLLPWW